MLSQARGLTTSAARPPEQMEWHETTYVTEPRGVYVQVYRDCWWATNDEGQIAIYRWRGGESPQCNMSKTIVERLGPDVGATGSVFLPLAFMPIRIADYQH